MEERYTHIVHTLPPIWDEHCRVLILGTLPSVASRAVEFYYGHPQNRFWPLMAELFSEDRPTTNEEKRELLLRHHIALWDVVSECDIILSSDSSIKNVVPNDLSAILSGANIENIYNNGGKSYELYRRYTQPLTGRESVKLPSTSPANAAFSLERLKAAWRVIL